MDEYFVSAQPKPVPAESPALTPEDVEKLDLSGFHEPFRSPRSLQVAGAVGKTMIALVMLAVAAVPVLMVVMVFRFLDSLPW
jgi:hypothetical protein